MRMASWGAAFALVSLIGPASLATAQGDEPPEVVQARQRFALGEEHYARGEFALALTEFERVFELLSSVQHTNAGVVLFNVARCYVQLGRDAEAIEAYERFLASTPETEPARQRAVTELRELRARASLGRGSSSAEGEIISPVGPVVAAVGLAAVLASAVTGGLALAADADARAGCVDGHCPAALASRADEAALLANTTDGLLFGGLAAAAVGAVLIFVLRESPSATAVSLGCSGEGCALLLRGRL